MVSGNLPRPADGAGPPLTGRGAGRRHLGRKLLVGAAGLVLLLAALFVGGFTAFLVSLDRSERQPGEIADGIVALTGGAGRVEDAVDLLAKGFGRRLLISGVNERTSLAAIKRLSPGQRGLAECCIDLDYRARNTVGNAAEIGKWVRGRGFRSLIVVTSYYHLPRALAELDEVLPDVRKVPYAVVPGGAAESGALPIGRMRLLASEYVKFVAASVRLRAAGFLNGSAWPVSAKRSAGAA